jgi:signal transduction histidine kinase
LTYILLFWLFGADSILKARSKINNSSPAIVTYYCLLAGPYNVGQDEKELYADSALLFFSNEQLTSEYPNEYFKSLLVKGDACFRAKKYIAALNYYYKGKKVLSSTSCDDGSLDTKMGNIYYKQKKFKLAARCWAESYQLVQTCNNTNTISRVYEIKQAALNNAGLSYERAGNLDSAKYFYLKDIELLKEADSIKILGRPLINQARVSLYDNLGGLYMATDSLAIAKDYLDKAVAMAIPVVDGIKIPPLIKLAQLYLDNGDNSKAAKVLDESRRLLDRFSDENIASEIKWNKLYAAYLYKLKQADKAYLYQEKYIKLVDSADNSWAELSRLDVERELNSISQRQALTELEQKEKTGTVYVVCSVIIGCLFVVIIALIYRNLAREKKNNKNTAAHNQQLQQAMDELERVNKNYVRIMRVMAHDLRNPLSGMKALATILLEESEFSEENKHLLRLIETTGMHTMEMINELLRSGLAHENEEIQKQTVDLRSLLYDVVELLQFRASEKKQNLVFESDGLPVETDVNRENMWRVFNNLIVNAIKFSQAGGTIRIGIKTDRKKVCIFVADNGIGIPDKDKDRVFDMFTAAKKNGTNGEEAFGLGLSISKRIVENHNGKIWFESNPGGGTVFYIELPVKKG